MQGEKDWQKYETARRLKSCVERLRTQYREDWKSKEMRIRQRAVALYFIDKVGNPDGAVLGSDPVHFVKFRPLAVHSVCILKKHLRCLTALLLSVTWPVP